MGIAKQEIVASWPMPRPVRLMCRIQTRQEEALEKKSGEASKAIVIPDSVEEWLAFQDEFRNYSGNEKVHYPDVLEALF